MLVTSAAAQDGRTIKTSQGLHVQVPAGWLASGDLVLTPPLAEEEEYYILSQDRAYFSADEQERVQAYFDAGVGHILPGARRMRGAFVDGGLGPAAILYYVATDDQGQTMCAVVFFTTFDKQCVTLRCVGTAVQVSHRAAAMASTFATLSRAASQEPALQIAVPRIAAPRETYASPVVAESTAAAGIDRGLLGTWTRNQTQSSRGGIGFVSVTDQHKLVFAADGSCTYSYASDVFGQVPGVEGRSRGNVTTQRGRWTTTGGTIDIRYENGDVLRESYSFFTHNGARMLKLFVPGGNSVYYYAN
jgi:hypothetical protein